MDSHTRVLVPRYSCSWWKFMYSRLSLASS